MPNKCDKTVNDKRPVNMDFGTIDMPIPSIVSILHRATGLFLVAGVALLLFLLDESLASEQQFNDVKALAGSLGFKIIVLVVLAGLIYHTVAGVKHLIMDMGIGETLEGGIVAAKLVFVVSAILTVLVGVWIW
jgi:succinate dehydrogenase / fumarate reductase cytochrome b subunit